MGKKSLYAKVLEPVEVLEYCGDGKTNRQNKHSRQLAREWRAKAQET